MSEDTKCKSCGGDGFVMLPAGADLDGVECLPCRGTGKKEE